ncbi:hypothetical protein JAAARDRAFT_136948 [Jaapia argillacea MUCL 33604]|uniref:Alpha/beta hydrolase fold-3 domain-containing protein n=1 Tax=Jaapia argillacea MUCL 33604 TaxID=933084 RepID=A0A067PTE7_9AGAM|nr:hypothetical protein JAAARDRAFT_136948 [Jaapia argillacea MUCL 33604]
MLGYHPFRYQPFRGLYLTYQVVLTTLVWVPIWTLISLPPFLRPRASWDFRRAFWVRVLRHLGYVETMVGSVPAPPNHTALVEGVKGLWIEPVPHLIVGEIKETAVADNVQAIRIPGYWTDTKGSDIPIGQAPILGEKVLYHLHGGGYVALSGNPRDPTAAIGRQVMRYYKPILRTFSIEYRLSQALPNTPANPFPAALIDAIAGYNYLVNVVGFSQADIIVQGDSAGGNLAIALTRYLLDNQGRSDVDIPAPPGALLLLSPWADIGTSHERPNSTFYTFTNSDYILADKYGDLAYKRAAIVGPFGLGAAETNRYISPASLHPIANSNTKGGLFKGFPRTFINAGGAEMLRDQIRTLRKKMVEDMGEGEGKGQVEYYEAPDAIHDYLVFNWHEPERTETLKRIAEWLGAGSA